MLKKKSVEMNEKPTASRKKASCSSRRNQRIWAEGIMLPGIENHRQVHSLQRRLKNLWKVIGGNRGKARGRSFEVFGFS